MITCKAAAELITAHVDGELAWSEVAALDGHLALCPVCKQRLCCERATKDMVRRRHCPAPVPERLRERIADAIARNVQRPAPVRQPGIAKTVEPLPQGRVVSY